MRFPRIQFLLHHKLWYASIFFFACLTAAYAGFLTFNSVPVVFSLIAGVGLAGLVLLGISYWPAIFLSTYIVYIFNHVPFVLVVFLAIGHTLQAVVGTYLLKKFNFDTTLSRVKDVTLFVAVSLSITVIVPIFGYIGMYLLQSTGESFNISVDWNQWWIGMIVSILVITPFIIHLSHRATVTKNIQIIERVGVFGLILGISILQFWEDIYQLGVIPLLYLLLVPLIWSALRFGPRMITLSILSISFFAVTGALFGAEETRTNVLFGQQLLQTEIFLIGISIIFLLLVSSQEELRVVNRKLVHNVRELKHTLDRLYTQDRAKNNFLAMIAHELRNPLAPVTSHLELLKMKNYVSAEGIESVSIIEKKLESLKRLLDDLLDISRIHENKIVLKKEIIDVRDAIISSVQNVQTSITLRNQILTTKLPEHTLPVKADSVRLEQIFTNLLFNASKFTEDTGYIEIEAKQDEKNIIVMVKDNGYGIDPATLPQIFNSFYQGKTTQTSTTSGLGIGLSVTRDLVKIHHGTITAKSEGLHKGSEFIVTLPIVKIPMHKTQHVPADQSAAPEIRSATRILVVDDNREAAEGIATLLEMSGFIVEYATTGAKALKKNISFKPDAFLLDIGLPDMSGHDVARTLRNEHQFNGIIVALSGYGQDSDVRKSYEAGCTYHLTKPARLAELLSVLTQASS